jgi:hypothetical protein
MVPLISAAATTVGSMVAIRNNATFFISILPVPERRLLFLRAPRQKCECDERKQHAVGNPTQNSSIGYP